MKIKGKVGSLPSHQLLWFLASNTSTRDSNPDLPAPRPVALPIGHRVGYEDKMLGRNSNTTSRKDPTLLKLQRSVVRPPERLGW